MRRLVAPRRVRPACRGVDRQLRPDVGAAGVRSPAQRHGLDDLKTASSFASSHPHRARRSLITHLDPHAPLVASHHQLDCPLAMAIGVIDELRRNAPGIEEEFVGTAIEIRLELATGDRATGRRPGDRHVKRGAPPSQRLRANARRGLLEFSSTLERARTRFTDGARAIRESPEARRQIVWVMFGLLVRPALLGHAWIALAGLFSQRPSPNPATGPRRFTGAGSNKSARWSVTRWGHRVNTQFSTEVANQRAPASAIPHRSANASRCLVRRWHGAVMPRRAGGRSVAPMTKWLRRVRIAGTQVQTRIGCARAARAAPSGLPYRTRRSATRHFRQPVVLCSRPAGARIVRDDRSFVCSVSATSISAYDAEFPALRADRRGGRQPDRSAAGDGLCSWRTRGLARPAGRDSLSCPREHVEPPRLRDCLCPVGKRSSPRSAPTSWLLGTNRSRLVSRCVAACRSAARRGCGSIEWLF